MKIIKDAPGFDSKLELVQVKREDLAEISEYLGCLTRWSEDYNAIVISTFNDGYGELIIEKNNYFYKSKHKNNERVYKVFEYDLQCQYVKREYKTYFNVMLLKLKTLQDELARTYKLLGPKAFSKGTNEKDLEKKQKKYNKVSSKSIEDLFQD